MGEGLSLIPNKGWRAGDGGHGHPTFTGHCRSDPTTVSTLPSCPGVPPRGGAEPGVSLVGRARRHRPQDGASRDTLNQARGQRASEALRTVRGGNGPLLVSSPSQQPEDGVASVAPVLACRPSCRGLCPEPSSASRHVPCTRNLLVLRGGAGRGEWGSQVG